MKIGFNKPYFTGNESLYIEDAVKRKKISGNGYYTKKCQDFFESNFGIKKTLLTTSCTDALEMCAILCDIKPGDEVIVPSFTFVSSALAFVRQGANIVFADSCSHNPNIDINEIEKLITKKTKVIVVVHYAGVPCDMEKVMSLAKENDLIVVEDAAQAINAKKLKKRNVTRSVIIVVTIIIIIPLLSSDNNNSNNNNNNNNNNHRHRLT